MCTVLACMYSIQYPANMPQTTLGSRLRFLLSERSWFQPQLSENEKPLECRVASDLRYHKFAFTWSCLYNYTIILKIHTVYWKHYKIIHIVSVLTYQMWLLWMEDFNNHLMKISVQKLHSSMIHNAACKMGSAEKKIVHQPLRRGV